MKTLVQNVRIVEAIAPAAAGSDLTGDFISLKHAAHVTVLVHLDQANAAPATINIEQAKDVSGTDAKALDAVVPIFAVLAAAVSDQWERQVDGIAYTTSASLAHKMIAFEIPAAELDVNGGFTSLRVVVTGSDDANTVSALYVASGVRYGEASLITD